MNTLHACTCVACLSTSLKGDKSVISLLAHLTSSKNNIDDSITTILNRMCDEHMKMLNTCSVILQSQTEEDTVNRMLSILNKSSS